MHYSTVYSWYTNVILSVFLHIYTNEYASVFSTFCMVHTRTSERDVQAVQYARKYRFLVFFPLATIRHSAVTSRKIL